MANYFSQKICYLTKPIDTRRNCKIILKKLTCRLLVIMLCRKSSWNILSTIRIGCTHAMIFGEKDE